jgi:peroxiredoxin
MKSDTFSSAKAQRIKEKLKVPLSTLEKFKLQWAEAVLAGDELEARKLWEKYRKLALAFNDTGTIPHSIDTMKPKLLSTKLHKTSALQDGILSKLEQAHIAEKPLKAGHMAPHFELPNIWGKMVSLRDLLNKGPVVLSFYRGIWCPFCSLETTTLEDMIPRIRELGAEFISISPKKTVNSLSAAEKINLTHQILSDRRNLVAGQFRIVFQLPLSLRSVFVEFGIDLKNYNGEGTFELPLPAIYVIDQDRQIRFAFTEANPTHKLDPELVIAVLQRIAYANV